MAAFDLQPFLAEKRALVEAALDAALAPGEPARIFEAMRYSLLAGGKRLRPVLCLTACELCGGTVSMALPTACAIEMIHTMSLIHDDLPAMDDDDTRRGRPANHKVFGEAIAILAGDGLLALAFEQAASTRGVPAERIVAVLGRLGRTVGPEGLVGGQVVDLESEGQPGITRETLDFIHTRKTGSLLETSVVCGALLAGAPEADLARLSAFARGVGLAFQIVDDILDITASPEALGKTTGKDARAQKTTYPKLWGLEASRAEAERLVASGLGELAPFGERAEPLRAMAAYILGRQY